MKRLAAAMLAALLLCGCTQLPLPTEPPETLPPSPYTAEDYVYEGEYLTCTAGSTVMGIDVSSHQGAIDWQQVAASGVEFVFIRLGNRGYESGKLNADAYALQNLAGAKAVGLKVGAYIFSQAVSVAEAREEAAFALGILGGIELDLPLVFDWEYVSAEARTADMDARTLTEITKAFCRDVELMGYESMVYFNSSQARDLLHLEELQAYSWWLAMYDITGEFPCKVDLWQYTNAGSIPGIQGNVDINLMFTDYGLGAQVFGRMD